MQFARWPKYCETPCRGRFSRSYIPRLQIVEEEPEEDPGIKEQTAKHLRELDGEWELTRRKGAGEGCYFGAKNHPYKKNE